MDNQSRRDIEGVGQQVEEKAKVAHKHYKGLSKFSHLIFLHYLTHIALRLIKTNMLIRKSNVVVCTGLFIYYLKHNKNVIHIVPR